MFQVFLGLHDAGDKRLATNCSVEEIFLHPDFQPNNYNNDIALLKLTARVEFNQLIRPVCLPPPHNKVGQTPLLLLNYTKHSGYAAGQVPIGEVFMLEDAEDTRPLVETYSYKYCTG